jgi:hypothetical protein
MVTLDALHATAAIDELGDIGVHLSVKTRYEPCAGAVQGAGCWKGAL